MNIDAAFYTYFPLICEYKLLLKLLILPKFLVIIGLRNGVGLLVFT